MHFTFVIACWLMQAVEPQPDLGPSDGPVLLLIEWTRATEPLEGLWEDASAVPPRVWRRFCGRVEDVGYYAKQAQIMMQWQDTRNVLYLDAYRLNQMIQELTVRARDSYDASEQRLRELRALERRYRHAAEAERRMKP